jgi:hypothetical protein
MEFASFPEGEEQIFERFMQQLTMSSLRPLRQAQGPQGASVAEP